MKEIDPKVFGPGTWTVTHILGLVSDEGGRKNDYRFFSLYVYRMVHALPCAKCRRHAVRYLNKHPTPTAESFASMFEWSVEFHNVVNKKLGKPILTVDQCRQIYSNTELILKDKKTGETCSINSCEDAPL